MIYDHPLIDRAYRASPLFAQNALVSAYGLLRQFERVMPVYRRYIRELSNTQWWSPDQLRALQDERLAALVRHAYDNVPYYRRIMSERGLVPADIRRADDLVKLPILRKEDVRRNSKLLRARNVPDRRVTTGRTGGTTGIPLAFGLDHARVMFDHALIERHWSWAGCNPGDRVALVRGLTLVPASDRTGAFWRQDYVNNRFYISGFHMS